MASFNDLSRQQLEAAAEAFGLQVDRRWNDATLAGKLIEKGVTIDQIDKAQEVLGASDAPTPALGMFSKETNGREIVKMERPNRSYSVIGYKFTSDHPYVVMPEDDAVWIINHVDGFRIAHPTEAARFYKGQ